MCTHVANWQVNKTCHDLKGLANFRKNAYLLFSIAPYHTWREHSSSSRTRRRGRRRAPCRCFCGTPLSTWPCEDSSSSWSSCGTLIGRIWKSGRRHGIVSFLLDLKEKNYSIPCNHSWRTGRPCPGTPGSHKRNTFQYAFLSSCLFVCCLFTYKMRKRKEERSKRKRDYINYLWSLGLTFMLIIQLHIYFTYYSMLFSQ